jgi:putative colanic acid biosynthesis acetyltransferase WcaF
VAKYAKLAALRGIGRLKQRKLVEGEPVPLPMTSIAAPSLADKARRAMWRLAWVLLCAPTPPSLHAWRALILRLFGAEVGAGVRVYGSARIWAPWNLKMAARSCIGPGVDFYNVGSISLGEGATISQRAFLCAASRDIRDPAHPLLVGGIDIGPGAWVAAEAYVGPGVAIGAGAVAAARAVVTRDVAPHTVVAGNPARAISVLR